MRATGSGWKRHLIARNDAALCWNPCSAAKHFTFNIGGRKREQFSRLRRESRDPIEKVLKTKLNSCDVGIKIIMSDAERIGVIVGKVCDELKSSAPFIPRTFFFLFSFNIRDPKFSLLGGVALTSTVKTCGFFVLFWDKYQYRYDFLSCFC